MIMKNWGIKNRPMASQMYDYMTKAMLRDVSINMRAFFSAVHQQRESTR